MNWAEEVNTQIVAKHYTMGILMLQNSPMNYDKHKFTNTVDLMCQWVLYGTMCVCLFLQYLCLCSFECAHNSLTQGSSDQSCKCYYEYLTYETGETMGVFQ